MANSVARRLVIPPHRDGGQAQYIEAALDAPGHHQGVARSMQWALENLVRPVTVADLAQVAHTSGCSYLRHFARAHRHHAVALADRPAADRGQGAAGDR
ncbi:MAG: hypothetical protein ACRDPO_22745 [Streptosporangiaceae bacterium]